MKGKAGIKVLTALFSVLLLLSCGVALANIHGVRRVEIAHAQRPPEYNLSQVEGEVTDAIQRTRRNLWVRVALLEIDPLADAGSQCGSGNSLFPAANLLCEVTNFVEDAARQAQTTAAITASIQSHVESDPSLASDLAGNIDKLLSSDHLQLRLSAAIEEFLAQNTSVEVVDGASATSSDHTIMTELVRVEAVGNKVDSRIAIRLHGKAVLVRNLDGAIVDEYSYALETPSHFIEGWSQGGIGLLANSVSNGIARMAEVLAEEILFIVTSPRQRGQGYLVKAVAPKYRSTPFGTTTFQSIGGSYRATETLQPTFVWEDFHDAYAEDPLYPDTTLSELEVTYDLRIYRARLSGNADPLLFARPPEMGMLLIAGELIREYRGISGQEFTPDIVFKSCTPYAWTIRTRFVVDDKTHLTHWSGSHQEKNVEKYRQMRISDAASNRLHRSMGALMGWSIQEMQLEEARYFPFLATSPGEKCSNDQIIAAMAEESH